MRHASAYLLAGPALAISVVAADACSVIERETAGVERGEQCMINHFSPEGDVFAGPAEKVSPDVVRQTINTGNACAGEQIVVYYDCAAKQGVWMGGDFDMMGAFSPEGEGMVTTESGQQAVIMSAGPAAWFIANNEVEFAPDYAIEAIASKRAELDWMPQGGRLGTPSITVDGKRFNLACGCDLPQTGGN